MKLYGYFRSSASYRVRIALNIKGLTVEHVPVHLTRGGGGHHAPEFVAKNPQGLVPLLELDDGTILTQSLAIIEYLDTVWPTPRLIPEAPVLAAKARAVALAIACDIHPLNNLRVQNYLKAELAQDQAGVDSWMRHWITTGLEAVEQLMVPGPFAFGSAPTLADVFLVPQLFNAHRIGFGLEHLPKIRAVEAACLTTPTFTAAHPSQQPDAE
jgi:maleylpyruvate isomerase